MIISTADFTGKHIEDIRDGAVFIYPTDTIYGIGCDATHPGAVARIRALKQRDSKPFSVIAPSREWILDNCELPAAGKEWVRKLPGPYTLIMTLKNKDCIDPEVNGGMPTIGIRIPAHWIAEVSARLNLPLVTTSVNISGQPFITDIKDIPKSIAKGVDFIIDGGKKEGRPSTLVDLTGQFPVVKER